MQTSYSQQSRSQYLDRLATEFLRKNANVKVESEDDFIVTKEWIKKNCTPAGGYKSAQLHLIGVHYPLKHGWIKSCVGKKITHKQKVGFESFSVGKITKKPKKDYSCVPQPTSFVRSLIPMCSCSVLPWEDCEHTGVVIDGDYSDRSIANILSSL